MTTQSWSTVLDHSTDAGFRAWGSELNTKLAAAGLVQTSDTGQINWVTVVRAGTSANAGYEIWRMNDAMQATAPVFFRIDYGTAGATNAPRMLMTCGTSTNGSGTLGGTALSTARQFTSGAAPGSTVTAFQSLLCVTSGFFGLCWKTGTSANNGTFLFARTVDSSGTPSATGGFMYWGSGNSGAFTAAQAMRYASVAAAYTVKNTAGNAQFCLVPMTPTTTAIGSDIQAFLWWTITPAMNPLLALCTVFNGEIAPTTTFTTTLVGVTPHTYIVLPASAGACDPSNSSSYSIAMIWE
jgi:hypothetical protein